MSQITVLGANSIPPGTFVETLTGNTGGAVGPSGTSNINIIGSGTISVTGNPGTNTLTISSSSSGGITTIDGDTGSVTGSTVSFIANPQAGSSVTFSGSGTTMSFNVTDGNFNTIIGNNAGNSAISGRFNTGLGEFALNSLVAGEYNTCIGLQAGYSYTGGSSNICIGAANFGVANEVNTLRIGNGTGSSSGNLAASYISGIQGVNVGSVASVVSIAASGDQLGTTVLTAGSGISITPGANSITIAASGGGGGITTIDGDSGSATGSTVTISGGTTGLTTTASSATMDLTGTLGIANGGTDATSFSTSTGIVKYDGTRLVTSSTAKISSANVATNTSQPCFLVNMQTSTGSITGDGTVAPIQFDTLVFDQASNITLNSSGMTIFTAPVTGKYLMQSQVNLVGTLVVTNNASQLRLVATSRTFLGSYLNPYVVQATGNACSVITSQMLDMTAGDTVYLAIYVTGASKDIGVQGPGNTGFVTSWWSGFLVC